MIISEILQLYRRKSVTLPLEMVFAPEVARVLQSHFWEHARGHSGKPASRKRQAPVRGPPLFPREQSTALTDCVMDVADCSTDIDRAQHLAAQLRNSITSEKFAERNGSPVFLWLLGGAH
jgi:hypothetical protein